MRSLRIAAILVALLLTGVFLGCGSKSNVAAHDLLDTYFKTQTSVATAGTKAKMEASLAAMESKAKSIKAELPEEFFNRYMRLIATTRLATDSPQTDEMKQEIRDYIRSVTGSPPPPGSDMDLTVSTAFALGTEVVKLDMLLDGETDFQKARKKQADRLK